MPNTFGMTSSLIYFPSQFFARKTKTSTYYKTRQAPKAEDGVRPSRLAKERLGKEAKDVTRQRVPGFLPDEIKFQQIMETDFTAEKEMKEEAERIQSMEILTNN